MKTEEKLRIEQEKYIFPTIHPDYWHSYSFQLTNVNKSQEKIIEKEFKTFEDKLKKHGLTLETLSDNSKLFKEKGVI